MKRFLGFIIFCGILALVVYIWWQHNAVRIITAQVRQQGDKFFSNAENITIGPDNLSVKLVNLHSARIPKLIISGNQLQLRNGPELSSAKLVLNDVTVSGPPFHITSIGSGSYLVKVNDTAVTEYLHSRGGSVAGFKVVPLDSLSVKFLGGRAQTTEVNGAATLKALNIRVPVTASGRLVPSSDLGKVDLRIMNVKIERLSIGVKEVRDALGVINPVIDLSKWPVTTEVKSIQTTKGSATLRGTVTGMSKSLIL